MVASGFGLLAFDFERALPGLCSAVHGKFSSGAVALMLFFTTLWIIGYSSTGDLSSYSEIVVVGIAFWHCRKLIVGYFDFVRLCATV